MNAAARALIERLGLAPLPEEGGFFRVTWRGAHGSAILFLITPEEFSALHRIAQDELWHFHAGDPVEHVRIDPATNNVVEDILVVKNTFGQAADAAAGTGALNGTVLARVPAVKQPNEGCKL